MVCRYDSLTISYLLLDLSSWGYWREICWDVCGLPRDILKLTNGNYGHCYLVRILAYHLLEAAQTPETRKTANVLRLFKIAVKTVRMCMGMFVTPHSYIKRREYEIYMLM